MHRTSITLTPIAHVRGGRREAIDDNWASVISTIELTDAFTPEALMGLGEFSHVEIVFCFHHVDELKVETTARHPRGNPAWPLVGIFAQRGKNRPNRLGVSVAKIVSVGGRELVVSGLDAIDGTPVLDIKPVMAEFLPRGELRQPAWSRELMANYW
jgi:tRNA-Thr(GGU) m(6)t(6)A37 methyltransferase TsaA